MTIEERLATFLDQRPQIEESAYVAKGAVVIGAVSLGHRSSVWHNAVLRGDINTIKIGEGSNVQDGTVIHLADDFGVKIGSYVTIGHSAMIHACEIGDECLIGMRSTILDGAMIGAQSIVGAGALVTKTATYQKVRWCSGRPLRWCAHSVMKNGLNSELWLRNT